MLTKEQVIKNLRDMQLNNTWNTAGDETFDTAIKAIEDVSKYRKKAKRWKRKYLEMRYRMEIKE